ncbi:retinol dehydrogenase 11-like isoform X1 [Homarus americanus]|uniref:retinol dehydrogenase 11-like n=2 Tax=Homarus americanus TaxID=6706 RepID=UPI001C46C92F|nr:retinol dehydrogenase 11-like [Homarus americanus]XP_042240718.1 retinol dehydrogenase 11-like isoform X1 [Homarus americanus]
MLLIALVVLLLARFTYRAYSGRCTSKRTLRGFTAIVTGGSAGIGKEAARDLAGRGARVILACRNQVKAQMVADEIMSATGNKEVLVRKLDTADLQSVRSFAQGILETEEALHILVNNAGMYGTEEREVSPDGLEITMATNYYGHFLLTNLLLELLKKSAPSRIINVSSAAHLFTRNINIKDLNFEKKSYGAFSAYSQSKLCNILFSLELSKKLRGSGVMVNSLHPGTVSTEIFLKEERTRSLPIKVICHLLNIIVKVAGKDSELGAQTIIHLAVSEKVEQVSGKYFEDCKEVGSSWLAQDKAVAKSLWEISEVDVQLRPSEMYY